MKLRLDIEHFLEHHWQRKHLYIPGGVANFQPPADANELAGLAMDPEVDSRIIFRKKGEWQQLQGPFESAAFQRSDAWSLLVQSVDHYWDEARDLLQLVQWLPGWRLDDVLMSYASDGGSAAPHFDNYDVFIIQGEGQRRWQIGGCYERASTISEDKQLSVLEDFHSDSEYLMQTGDVLYIPPGCAHYGVSLGESTSISIGFRAPRISDLLAQFTDHTLATMDQQRLFRDPGRSASLRPGEIDLADLERAREQLLACLQDTDITWFGEAITASVANHAPEELDGAIDLVALEASATLRKTPGRQIAWSNGADKITVFANGSAHETPVAMQSLVESLCNGREINIAHTLEQNGHALALMQWLLEEGALEIYD